MHGAVVRCDLENPHEKVMRDKLRSAGRSD